MGKIPHILVVGSYMMDLVASTKRARVRVKPSSV